MNLKLNKALGAIIAAAIISTLYKSFALILPSVLPAADVTTMFITWMIIFAAVLWITKQALNHLPPFAHDPRQIIMVNGMILWSVTNNLAPYFSTDASEVLKAWLEAIGIILFFNVLFSRSIFKRYMSLGDWDDPQRGKVKGVLDRETQRAVLIVGKEYLDVDTAIYYGEALTMVAALRLDPESALSKREHIPSLMIQPENIALIEQFRSKKSIVTPIRVIALAAILSALLFWRSLGGIAAVPGVALVVIWMRFIAPRFFAEVNRAYARMVTQQDFTGAIVAFRYAQERFDARPWLQRWLPFFTLTYPSWSMREVILTNIALCYSYEQNKALAIETYETIVKEFADSSLSQLALNLIHVLHPDEQAEDEAESDSPPITPSDEAPDIG